MKPRLDQNCCPSEVGFPLINLPSDFFVWQWKPDMFLQVANRRLKVCTGCLHCDERNQYLRSSVLIALLNCTAGRWHVLVQGFWRPCRTRDRCNRELRPGGFLDSQMERERFGAIQGDMWFSRSGAKIGWLIFTVNTGVLWKLINC